MGTLRTSVLITAQNLLSPHLERINNDLERVNATIEKSNKGQLTALSTGLRNAGFAFTAFGAAGTAAIAKVANEAGKFEQTRVAFTTMLGSAEAAQKMLDNLASFATRTPFTIEGVERSAKQLLAVGYNAQEVIPTLKSIGDVAAGLSLGEDGLQRLILNLGQVRAQGKLTGRELRDFAVNGVPIMDELAKMMDKPKAAIAEMTEQGQISAPIVEEAFRRMSGEGGRFADLMDKQSKTMLGSFSNLQDSVSRLARELGQPFLAPLTSAFNTLAGVINSARERFAALPDGVKTAIAAFAAIATAAATIVGGLGLLMSQLGTLKAAWTALSGVMSIGASTLAAFAWPITLVVGGLTLLYLWVTKTETGHRVFTATINGLKNALSAVGTFIANTARLLQAVWNVTAPLREEIANRLNKAIENLSAAISGAIGWLGGLWQRFKDVGDMIKNYVMDKISAVIGLLKQIPGVGAAIEVAQEGVATATVAATAVMSAMTPAINAVAAEYNRLEQASIESQANVDSAADSMGAAAGSAFNLQDAMGAIDGGGTGKAKEDAEKLAESIADLETSYDDSMTEIKEKIFDLDNTHKEKMQSIRDEMQKVSDQVTKLKDDYTKSIADMQASTASKIVEEQENINDLLKKRTDIQKELANAQRDLDEKAQKYGNVSSMAPGEREDAQDKIDKAQTRLDELNAEIEKRQAAYNQVTQSGVVSAEELAEAQRRASLTDLQRFIEDQNIKKEEAKVAHEEKLQQLDDEMAKLQEQADKEVSIYNIKRQDYEQTKIVMQSWHDAYVANLQNMGAVTQKEVDAMKKRLEELRKTISEIQALMKSQSSVSTRLDARVSAGGTNIPQYANGGIINRDGLYRGAEGDRAEAVVPLPDGRQIPVKLNDGGRAVSVTIDMSGMTVQNGADADEIVRRVKGEVVEAIINAPLESR